MNKAWLGGKYGANQRIFNLESSNHGSPGMPSRNGDMLLASVTQKKIIEVGKRFFTWGKQNYPKEFGSLTTAWLESLRSPVQGWGILHLRCQLDGLWIEHADGHERQAAQRPTPRPAGARVVSYRITNTKRKEY